MEMDQKGKAVSKPIHTPRRYRYFKRPADIKKGDQWQNGAGTVSKNRKWYRVPDWYNGLPMCAYPELNFRRIVR